MNRVFSNAKIEGFRDRDSGAIFENLEFINCIFLGCDLSRTERPEFRSIVRNVRMTNTEARGCLINAAIVEDVLVEGLLAHNSAIHGAVFKHVTFAGRVGQIKINHFILPSITPVSIDVQNAFDKANQQYYSTVDWALDISNAEFKEADIRGVPARLIRRDPETQFVLTRKRALQGNWKDVDLSGTYWNTSIDFFLEEEEEDRVLVAPKRDRNFKRLIEALKELQRAGVLEPD